MKAPPLKGAKLAFALVVFSVISGCVSQSGTGSNGQLAAGLSPATVQQETEGPLLAENALSLTEDSQVAEGGDQISVVVPTKAKRRTSGLIAQQANQPTTPQKPEVEQTQVASLNPSSSGQSAEIVVPTASAQGAVASDQADGAPAALAEKSAASAKQAKKPNFFQRLFAKKKTSDAAKAATANSVGIVSTANASVTQTPSVSAAANTGALPGVKSNNEIFGIEEDEDLADVENATQLAALGGLGVLSPNGLRVQHSKVKVDCLKPGILRILKMVEHKYRKKPIITSGYRNPKRNRRAGGVRNSMHIYCKAVDIQIEGVSKWNLAKYLRTLPGRGGVGTYCRTKSVHIDTGSKRDWHHPCRRKKKKKA